jgi:hypothetical protein
LRKAGFQVPRKFERTVVHPEEIETPSWSDFDVVDRRPHEAPASDGRPELELPLRLAPSTELEEKRLDGGGRRIIRVDMLGEVAVKPDAVALP